MAPIAWMLVSLLSPDSDPSSFMNVRLGMSPSQIRSRIARPGSWSTATGPDGLLVLTWEPDDPNDPVEEARFEVHEGLLVAVRAQLRESHSEPLSIAPESVRQTLPRPEGGAQMTLLTRGCPLHEEEVADLMGTR